MYLHLKKVIMYSQVLCLLFAVGYEHTKAVEVPDSKAEALLVVALSQVPHKLEGLRHL